MWFMEDPSHFSVGQTATSLNGFIVEKPHTGLDACLNILLSCFRKRMSDRTCLVLLVGAVLVVLLHVLLPQPHRRHLPLLRQPLDEPDLVAAEAVGALLRARPLQDLAEVRPTHHVWQAVRRSAAALRFDSV